MGRPESRGPRSQPGRNSDCGRGSERRRASFLERDRRESCRAPHKGGGGERRRWPTDRTASCWPARARISTSIEVWDANTLVRTSRLQGHTGPVYSVAFDSDGRRLVSASSDHTVRVWDVDKRECLTVLRGHTDEVFSAAFHPDGAQIASAGRDRAIWLWDLTTGQEVARLEGHADYIFSLAFSPDGVSLVSGSGDGTVRVWDTVPRTNRQNARREAEALRPEAERRMKVLFGTQHGDANSVAAAVRGDHSLNDRERHAVFRALAPAVIDESCRVTPSRRVRRPSSGGPD